MRKSDAAFIAHTHGHDSLNSSYHHQPISAHQTTQTQSLSLSGSNRNSVDLTSTTTNASHSSRDSKHIISSREDNIRFGWLLKASRSGTTPFSSSSSSSTWKHKYIELRHGVFVYEDDYPEAA